MMEDKKGKDGQNKDKMEFMPEHFVKGINRTVQTEMTGQTPLDEIMKQVQNRVGPKPVAGGGQEQSPIAGKLEIDGYELPLYHESMFNTMTLIMYLFVTLYGDDERVKHILDAVNFQFPDLNGKMIYPKKKAKRSKKKRNVKSKKRKVQ